MANVEYDHIKLTCTQEEIYTLGWAVLREYCDEHVFESHWKHHAGSWREYTRHYSTLAKTLFASIGRLDIFESKEKEMMERLSSIKKE
jgi:hypothetical protein